MTRPAEFVEEAAPKRSSTTVGGVMVGPGAGDYPQVPVGNGDGTATWTSLLDLGLFLRTRFGEVHDWEDHEELGASAIFDLANGNAHVGILDTDDCDIVFTNWTPNKWCETTVALLQDSVGGHRPNFLGATWIGGEPDWDLTPDTWTFVVLISWTGGTLIFAGTPGGSGATSPEGGMVPFHIPAFQTFTVPTDRQAYAWEDITIDAGGELVVLGDLLVAA